MDTGEMPKKGALEDTMNAADYIDALLRPPPNRLVVTRQKIKGRRLRDQYVEEVTVTKVVPAPK
ncbi:MAG TPA: hypothetical protein VFB20_03875 [Burkholderiales bacterium]|nr:hypothetical protein [Burkholderiales bacterium]